MERKYNNAWNDLTTEERKRLMTHQIESQILHICQCREIAVRNHRQHLKELDDWLNNLEHELSKYNTEMSLGVRRERS